jgi:hypothetical protein
MQTKISRAQRTSTTTVGLVATIEDGQYTLTDAHGRIAATGPEFDATLATAIEWLAANPHDVRRRSIVPNAYKAKYALTKDTCGDSLAFAIKDLVNPTGKRVEIESLEALMAANGIDTDRWSHLNNGQRVMNTSNVLRAKVKRGERVVVGDDSYGA